jgi:hypothetical protein
MTTMTALRTTGFALGVALLSACASNPTTVAETWVAPGVTKLEAKRLLIVALAPSEAARRRMETELSKRMVKSNPTESNIVLSEVDLKDTAKAIEKVKAAGYDKAVVMRLIDAQSYTMKQPQAMPTYMGDSPYYSRSVNVQATNYVIETTIFDITDGKPLARVTTETFQTTDPAVLAGRLFESVSDALRSRGLIP